MLVLLHMFNKEIIQSAFALNRLFNLVVSVFALLVQHFHKTLVLLVMSNIVLYVIKLMFVLPARIIYNLPLQMEFQFVSVLIVLLS